MTTTGNPLIIIGNQAGDLDSTVCTIAVARLFAVKNTLPSIPLLRTPGDELRLKPEIPALLSYAGIDSHSFTFQNSPQGTALLNNTTSRFFLVDHNIPEGIGKEETIAGIIDHHKDGGLLPDLPVRIIQTCGSCASLVSREWQKSGITPDRVTALLLNAAIVVDTGNFNPDWGKTTELDRQQSDFLGTVLSQKDQDFIRTLIRIKKDISSLSMDDLLRRDYKDIPFQEIKAGICSLPCSQETFFHPPFYSDQVIGNFLRAKGLDILFIMHTMQEPFRRELSFCMIPEDSQEEILRYIRSKLLSHREIQLVPGDEVMVSTYPWMRFRQENNAISRKILLPVLQQILEDFCSANL